METNNRKIDKMLLYTADLYFAASVIIFTVLVSKFFNSFFQHDRRKVKSEMAWT